jgi:hypothetical protein
VSDYEETKRRAMRSITFTKCMLGTIAVPVLVLVFTADVDGGAGFDGALSSTVVSSAANC